MSQRLEHAWAATVAAAPSALAVIEAGAGRTWTRAELAADVAAWGMRFDAAWASAVEVSGAHVLLAEGNGVGWLVALLALLARGAVVVPIDPNDPPAAVEHAAAAARAHWLWRGGQLEPIGAGEREGGGAQVKRAKSRGDRAGDAGGRGPCLVKLTSGSTGAPRAQVFSHAQMLADGRQVCATMDVTADDRNLAVIPFGHSYGLGNLVVPLLTQGTAIVVADSPLPQVLAATCARWRPTVFPAVPALLRALVASDVDAADLASLRTVISAGAPLAPEIAQAWVAKFGAARRVHGFYGSSETGGITYDRGGEATLTGRSVGTPLEGVRLAWTAGGGKRFTVTSAAVRGTGRARPADRGELNALGELVLLGRAGRMLKLAGRRLDPAEVEAALRAVSGVREAWAAAHPTRPDALAAVVATELAPEALRLALRGRLAGWKIPARIVTVAPADWPLTTRGKTDTRALRARLAMPGG